jgi:hypothetical protein
MGPLGPLAPPIRLLLPATHPGVVLKVVLLPLVVPLQGGRVLVQQPQVITGCDYLLGAAHPVVVAWPQDSKVGGR